VFDVDKAVQYLDSHAQRHSLHKCATYVGDAIRNPAAGGQPMGHTLNAKDYGPELESAGFRQVTDGTLQKGDVAVIQPYPGGNQAGHMTMYDGKDWVSDFNQGSNMYPGPGYRANQPPYKIYRHQGGGSSGTGVQAITQQGKKVHKGADHGVRVGPKQRHLSHKTAELEGGGNVTGGSGTVKVASARFDVARVNDSTTHGPITIGEGSVLIG
jgi:hypothetical protein